MAVKQKLNVSAKTAMPYHIAKTTVVRKKITKTKLQMQFLHLLSQEIIFRLC